MISNEIDILILEAMRDGAIRTASEIWEKIDPDCATFCIPEIAASCKRLIEKEKLTVKKRK